MNNFSMGFLPQGVLTDDKCGMCSNFLNLAKWSELVLAQSKQTPQIIYITNNSSFINIDFRPEYTHRILRLYPQWPYALTNICHVYIILSNSCITTAGP